MFAVSPDDRRIALSIIDYTSSPPHARLYVEDLLGGNHIDLPSPATGFVLPRGWHDGQLILGVVQGADPAAQLSSYEVVNAGTSNVLATTCGPPVGEPIDVPGPGGSLCGTYPRGTEISDWTGGNRTLAESFCVSMAPHAQSVVCVDPPSSYHVLFADGHVAPIPGAAVGWIDDTWLVITVPYHATTTGGYDHAVYDVSTGVQIPVQIGGEISIGRLPGSL